jgi:vacuolar protein sorting-associated protein 26
LKTACILNSSSVRASNYCFGLCFLNVCFKDCVPNLYLLCLPVRYHLKDVIVGKIYFLLVRIKIKHMELEIRKRETTGSGSSTFHQSETLAKYEIMDGAPVRGEDT